MNFSIRRKVVQNVLQEEEKQECLLWFQIRITICPRRSLDGKDSIQANGLFGTHFLAAETSDTELRIDLWETVHHGKG